MSAPFNLLPGGLPGVHVIEPRPFADKRGAFVKTYHEAAWRESGLDFALREEYYSVSHQGVLRGMHFQVPPEDHAKMLYCPCGRVLDVLLDLRKSSPTFGRAVARELSAQNRLVLLIPTGIAHGFLALENHSVVVYKASTVHSPAHDAGVRWDSFGFDWGVASPVVSDRDAAFPTLAGFASPFA